jgi:AcrR family transcriptional regulator
MPRRFTIEEEQAIRAALLGAGRRIMGTRGVRKTSIDDLVREAGISKGSFYRFFPGKEALALEVLAGWEREFHKGIHDLFRRAEPRGVDGTAAALYAVFLEEFPRRVGESGLQGLMQPEEIAYLARAADPDQTRVMDEQDLRFFAELKPLLAASGLEISVPDEVVMAGFRMLFDAAIAILAAGDAGVASEAVPPSGAAGPAGDAPHEGSGRSLENDHFRAAFTLLIRGLLSQACKQKERDDDR